MNEIINSLNLSILRLEEALAAEETIINRDGSIKRFEFTVELAWKSVQKFLRQEEIVCQSPKSCMKEAFTFGLIEDNPIWIEMFEDRNLTTHTYDEGAAQNVYRRLSKYLTALKTLRDALVSRSVD